jgi:Domain of unknown function (DUF4331)
VSAVCHHADSPRALAAPELAICDVFLFRGQAGTVMVLTANPFSAAGGFHAAGRYEWHVDLNGDARPDLTFRLLFGPPARDGRQDAELRLIESSQASQPDAQGEVLAAGRTGTVMEGRHGVRAWAGQRADPCWLNERVQQAARLAIANGIPFGTDIGTVLPPMNIYGYANVSAIVIEVPDSLLTGTCSGACAMGLWASTAIPAPGGWRQVSRCAQPLLSSLFGLDGGLPGRDFDATPPHRDRELYGQIVRQGTARAVAVLGTVADPAAHGARIADALLPDVLRYQVGTAARYRGVRNGRGLRDPAAEVMISAVLGAHIPLGLDHTSVTVPPRSVFPYLGRPVSLAAARPLR